MAAVGLREKDDPEKAAGSETKHLDQYRREVEAMGWYQRYLYQVVDVTKTAARAADLRTAEVVMEEFGSQVKEMVKEVVLKRQTAHCGLAAGYPMSVKLMVLQHAAEDSFLPFYMRVPIKALPWAPAPGSSLGLYSM
ncbi:hypothetical protein CRENBAI_015577 [Crenichthys baileyi]|uniref:Uncharacterized protein n=1 Tax=Crenichthys baileyi TaxID=28760 RepID=A0AAV9R7K8_9TELE